MDDEEDVLSRKVRFALLWQWSDILEKDLGRIWPQNLNFHPMRLRRSLGGSFRQKRDGCREIIAPTWRQHLSILQATSLSRNKHITLTVHSSP